MTALELYKFCHDHPMEYHWIDDNEKVSGYKEDVILFVETYNIEEFMKLLKSGRMNEEGFECRMKNKYFCFWMADICELFDIDIEQIFPR